jgi:hypothetical protein
MEWTIRLERLTQNYLNVGRTKKHLDRIVSIAERNSSLGFSGRMRGLSKLDAPEVLKDGQKRYAVSLNLSERKARTDAIAERRYQHVLKLVIQRAARYGWNVLVDGKPAPAVLVQDQDKPTGRPPFSLPPLTPETYGSVFDGIYERDSHIRLIHDSLSLFVTTKGEMRPHTVLYGEPAAAKTELFKRFKAWYEKDSPVERVAEIDGHSMSRAGLEGWVIERTNDNCLPEVVFIEEIEKQDEKILLPLISIMGSGYFAKLNARVDFRGKTPFVVWATCNDLDKLQSFAKGALFSRFTNQWECRRPSRELMGRILQRELARIPMANPRWAEAALTIGWDRLSLRDPRKIIGLLAGRDRLLDGSYERDQVSVLGTK